MRQLGRSLLPKQLRKEIYRRRQKRKKRATIENLFYGAANGFERSVHAREKKKNRSQRKSGNPVDFNEILFCIKIFFKSHFLALKVFWERIYFKMSTYDHDTCFICFSRLTASFKNTLIVSEWCLMHETSERVQ